MNQNMTVPGVKENLKPTMKFYKFSNYNYISIEYLPGAVDVIVIVVISLFFPTYTNFQGM